MPADVNPAVTTDYYHFHWNFWWIRHAFENGLNAYETNYVFAPPTSSLALHTLAAFWYPIWALLEPEFGTIVAMLGVYFAALLLNGYVFWVFLEEQEAPPVLSIVGGLLLQGSATMIDSMRWSMVNLMGWFWIPLVIMLWMRQIRKGSRSILWSLLLGVSLWAMILTDLQYVVFLGLILVPIAVWTVATSVLRQPRDWQPTMTIVVCVVAALVTALVLLLLTGTLQAVMGFDRSILATTPADRAPDVLFPNGYLLRLDEGISFGSLLIPLYVMGIVIFFMRRPLDRRRGSSLRILSIPPWLWLVISAVPLVLSAGNAITVGEFTIELPYTWLHNLLGGTFRYPERFTNVFIISALAFSFPQIGAWVVKQKNRSLLLGLGTSALLLLALLDIRLFGSIPIRQIPTPYHFYTIMGDEPYDYVVIEVPTAGASGEGIVGRSDWAATQFYGVTHGKRMINGHISRVDPWRYLYMETADPMLAWLGQRRYLDEDAVRAQLAERIYSFPIGYIVIHTEWLPQSGPTLQEILGFLNAQTDLICPVWIEGDAIVYRTRWHPDGCPPRTPTVVDGQYEIDIGTPDDQRFIGWGWHYAEPVGGLNWRWMGDYPRLGSESVPVDGFLYSNLYLQLPRGAYDLQFRAQSFAEVRTLTLLMNGEVIGQVDVQPATIQEYSLPMVVNDGTLSLQFEYDSAPSPAEMGLGEDERRLSVAIDSVQFVPRN